jgi:hypothetical protein
LEPRRRKERKEEQKVSLGGFFARAGGRAALRLGVFRMIAVSATWKILKDSTFPFEAPPGASLESSN